MDIIGITQNGIDIIAVTSSRLVIIRYDIIINLPWFYSYG